jgi:hypothetical protein
MLLVTLALLAAGNPRETALGVAVVAAGVPVYRIVIASRHARSKEARLEEA